MFVCSICGGSTFVDHSILWDQLASEWQLSPDERSYIERQQGTSCTSCGSNLRSIALANAIRAAVGTNLTLTEFVKTPEAGLLSLLEINEAGNLSSILRQLPGHVLATYPSVDMHAMPYSTDSFDLVVHSDTLEHVSNPIPALAECRRVLSPNGTLCLTIPTIVGRLTRSRAGLPKSYHGNAATGSDDLVVHTEFGADMWTYVLRAGFSAVSITSVDFPSALALSARKEKVATRSLGFHPSTTCNTKTPKRIVAVHFPKAGGSSLQSQLLGLLGDSLALDYGHDPLTSAGLETAEFPVGKRGVYGHFSARRYASTDGYWMTFLRDPVDNLISIYYYWKSVTVPGHDLHGRFLREKPSILDFAKYAGVQRLMSETYFGGFDMGRFDFIGFHETRDRDIPRLAAALDLPLSAEVYVNKTEPYTERHIVEDDTSLRRQLADLLADDVAFYERLRN